MIFVALSLHPPTKHCSFSTEIYVITPQFEIHLNNFLGLVPILRYSKIVVGIKNKLYIDRELNFPISYKTIEERATRKLKCDSCRSLCHYSWNCVRSLATELKDEGSFVTPEF